MVYFLVLTVSQFAIRMNTVNEDGSSLFTPRLSPGYRPTDRERRILAAAWNGYVRRGLRISLRPFAWMHVLAAA